MLHWAEKASLIGSRKYCQCGSPRHQHGERPSYSLSVLQELNFQMPQPTYCRRLRFLDYKSHKATRYSQACSHTCNLSLCSLHSCTPTAPHNSLGEKTRINVSPTSFWHLISFVSTYPKRDIKNRSLFTDKVTLSWKILIYFQPFSLWAY